MPKKKRAFEEIVLEQRAKERDRYGKALSSERGALPYGKELSEEEQDAMWEFTDEQYRNNPAAVALLVAPQEQGGMGLTPLAASLVMHPHRKRLYEGEGPSITDHIAYARRRQERLAKKAPAMPPMPEPMAAPAAPLPDPMMPPQAAAPTPAPQPAPPAAPPMAGEGVV